MIIISIGSNLKSNTYSSRVKACQHSVELIKETGVKDAYVKVLPVDGYGNPDLLRDIMKIEKPDAIMHFTDPRFWGWLYAMGHEIRTKIPAIHHTGRSFETGCRE